MWLPRGGRLGGGRRGAARMVGWRPGLQCEAGRPPGRGGPNATPMSSPSTVMVTVRSVGISQWISVQRAWAMACFLASSAQSGGAAGMPVLHQALGDAEARGDCGHRGAGPGDLGERDHLVGGVHRDADDVFRERELAGIAVRGDLARHRVEGIEGAVLGERLQGREAASAGDDGIALGAVLGGIVGAGDEVLQQAVRLDGGDELGVGGLVGRGLAHVLGRERELAKRDVADRRFRRGCDVVHSNLHGWTDWRRGRGSLRPACARPGRARLRLGLLLLRCPGAGGGPAGAVPGGVVRGFAGDWSGRPPGGVGRWIGPIRGVVEEPRGLAERIRRVPHAAGADQRFGPEVGVGSPRYPERELGQGFERLPQRLGGGAVDRADHGEALRSGAMSMRSPQGSRFHSDGGGPQLTQATGNPGSASG